VSTYSSRLEVDFLTRLSGLKAVTTKRQATFAVDAIVISIIDKVTSIIQGMIDSDVNVS